MSDENTDNIQKDPQVQGDETGITTEGPNTEDHAAKAGHKGYEKYISDGGKPELYQSPEVFLALKEPLRTLKQQSKRLRQQEAEFDKRIQGQNVMHQAQLETQKSQLIANRDAAIDDLDKDAARNYQNQIDKIPPAQPTQQAPVQSQDVQDWSADPKNAWIDKPGAKSTYAQSQFQAYLNKGHDDITSIRLMESDISREFPEINSNAKTAPQIEGGTKPGNRASINVEMADLTPEESSIWKHSSSMWKGDKKAFLQSVKDSRSGK